MKIRIDTPIAKLTTDLPEEIIFNLLQVVLDIASHGIPEIPSLTKESSKPVTPIVTGSATASPVEPMATSKAPDPKPERNPKVPAPPAKVEYKGFLFIKCEKCGKYKAFMPKTPINKFHCDCGHVTNLRDMKAMKFQCECGNDFKYLTNSTDSHVTLDCVRCGTPVELEYHERKQEYLRLE